MRYTMRTSAAACTTTTATNNSQLNLRVFNYHDKAAAEAAVSCQLQKTVLTVSPSSPSPQLSPVFASQRLLSAALAAVDYTHLTKSTAKSADQTSPRSPSAAAATAMLPFTTAEGAIIHSSTVAGEPSQPQQQQQMKGHV